MTKKVFHACAIFCTVGSPLAEVFHRGNERKSGLTPIGNDPMSFQRMFLIFHALSARNELSLLEDLAHLPTSHSRDFINEISTGSLHMFDKKNLRRHSFVTFGLLSFQLVSSSFDSIVESMNYSRTSCRISAFNPLWNGAESHAVVPSKLSERSFFLQCSQRDEYMTVLT